MGLSYNIVHNKISSSKDFKNIDTVASLEYYIINYGITKELINYLNLSEEKIIDIWKYCYGGISINLLLKDSSKYIFEGLKMECGLTKLYPFEIELKYQMEEMKYFFCDIGLNAVKRLLNRLTKKGDNISEVLATLLEAKYELTKARLSYRCKRYNDRIALIWKMIELYQENGLKYGIRRQGRSKRRYYVYFELPTTNEVISFELRMDKEKAKTYPIYEKNVYMEDLSILPKIEKSILATYPNEINSIIEKRKKKAEKEKMKKQ